MAISFDCEVCGKAFTVRDELAGKTGQCKQCGHRMLIPTPNDEDAYGFDDPEPEPEPELAPLPPRTSQPPPPSSSKPTRTLFDPPASPRPQKKGFFSFGGNERGGLTAALLVVAGIGLRMYFRWDRAQARRGPNPPANAMAPRDAGAIANPFQGQAVDRSEPIRLPNFPKVGRGREIEPGIMLHEIKLGSARPPIGSPPGHGGKLWLYLPSGKHPNGSLPCVLITGAGSRLIDGMELGDGDRPEHLPYARAGFAVLAFELDGALQNPKNPSDQEMGESMLRFLNARAGLVNARIAIEYVLKRVPQVDPSRISAAGHSSAGTLAVLFAENEPRLRACVAFAPALDLAKRFGPQGVNQLTQAGAGDLVTRYSPKNNLETLAVPLFLFHAKDDSNVPARDSEAFANELKAKGKPVTLDLVDTGNHYDSMITEGIPHAIDWLKGQGAGPTP